MSTEGGVERAPRRGSSARPGAGRSAGAGRARPRRVSMAQVAALAGVSGQTVSRVANGSPRVDPATRARVETAMRELGYRPHRAARALRTGRSGAIGLVVTTLATVGNSRMLQAVVEQAAERGYGVAVATVSGADGMGAAFDRLRDQGVDGAILLNEASALVGAARIPDDVPVVVVDAPPGAAAHVVASDHRGGARAAVAHLIGLGHRRVAHLAGPARSFAAAEREAGWREALAEAGLEAPEPLRGDWSADSGFAAARALAECRPLAVFSANDQMALGLVRGLAARGVAVPRDVSVVGFDDVPDAANYLPPLTTVRQDFPALAAHAVEALASLLAAGGDGASARVVVPAPLAVRDSTAPAAP